MLLIPKSARQQTRYLNDIEYGLRVPKPPVTNESSPEVAGVTAVDLVGVRFTVVRVTVVRILVPIAVV
jgi:ribosomal protein S12